MNSDLTLKKRATEIENNSAIEDKSENASSSGSNESEIKNEPSTHIKMTSWNEDERIVALLEEQKALDKENEIMKEALTYAKATLALEKAMHYISEQMMI